MCQYDRVSMGKRIKKRRLSMGYTQAELAEKLEISNNHLSGIEKGASNTTLDMLMKLCEILKTTPDYFLLGNMRTNNVPQNIMECLLLCTEEDLELIDCIVKRMAERNQNAFSKKHI